jgi:hypothetical protein
MGVSASTLGFLDWRSDLRPTENSPCSCVDDLRRRLHGFGSWNEHRAALLTLTQWRQFHFRFVSVAYMAWPVRLMLSSRVSDPTLFPHPL